ncbi:MAG: hypothetical protein NC429_06995 [Lachnospiraceae bacterium]|nr:hypothetical protein [Lachnospiraceae bacterium]
MAYFNTENIKELMLRHISKDEFLAMENLSENDMKECVYKELLIIVMTRGKVDYAEWRNSCCLYTG